MRQFEKSKENWATEQTQGTVRLASGMQCWHCHLWLGVGRGWEEKNLSPVQASVWQGTVLSSKGRLFSAACIPSSLVRSQGL